MTTVHLANTHRWLYEQLTELADLDLATAFVERRRDADVIIYPRPPWPDPGAPESVRSFRPSELARCYVFSQDDEPFPWAPGMYASLPASHARPGMTGGFYVAPNHRGGDMLTEDLEAARAVEPDLLWSFVGTIANAPARMRLADLEDRDALVIDTQRFSDEIRWDVTPGSPERRAAHAGYAQSLGRSLFVACPRGRGAGSMRLFEAMQAGRCPVIISDGWLEPPFVDWASCSIRVAESQIAELPALLRARRDEGEALGRAAREAWEEYFSPQRQLRTLTQAAALVSSSPANRLRDLGEAVARVQTARHVVRRTRISIRRVLRRGGRVG